MLDTIVIIHTGYSKALYYSILQARKTNPNAKIFLIGDKENKKLSKYSTFVDIETLYSDDIALFEKVYVHLGKSSRMFEMFCIKRWFILRNLMLSHKIDRCLHIDSDVMLFCDVSSTFESLSYYDAALTSALAITMNINNVEVLKGFCNFVIETYRNEDRLNGLKNMYHSGRHNEGVGGSISDMDLSRIFFSKNSFSLFDIAQIYNESIFDCAIIYGRPSFKMKKKMKYEMKEAFFEDGILYCMYLQNNEYSKVKLNSLHFISYSKIYMKKIFKCHNLDFNPIYINLYREASVLYKKIIYIFKKIG